MGRFLATRLGHAAAGTCFALSAMLAVVALTQPSRTALPSPAAMVRSPSPLDADVDGLRRQLGALETRLGRGEARLGVAESRLAAGEANGDTVASRVVRMEERLRAAEASLRRVNADTDRALAGLKQLSTRSATPPPVRRPGPTPVAPPPAVGSPSARPSLDAALRPSPERAGATAARRETLSTGAASRPAGVDPGERPRPLAEKLREDWEEVKRDRRLAGDEIGKAFRRFRDMLNR